MIHTMIYGSGLFFPNTLSQQVEGQDKDEPISQNFILKNTIKGTLFRKDNF